MTARNERQQRMYNQAAERAARLKAFTAQEVSPEGQALDLTQDEQRRFICIVPSYTDVTGCKHPAIWKLRPPLPIKKQFTQQRWQDLPELLESEQPTLF